MRFGRTLVSFIGLTVLLLNGELWVNRVTVKWGTVVNTRTRRAEVTDCFYIHERWYQ